MNSISEKLYSTAEAVETGIVKAIAVQVRERNQHFIL